jgi:hypothetical protein
VKTVPESKIVETLLEEALRLAEELEEAPSTPGFSLLDFAAPSGVM